MLLPRILEANNLLTKIQILIDHEIIPQNKSVESTGKLLTKNYESLWFRPGQEFTNAYIEELKSCRAHTQVIISWPNNFFDDVTVCKKNTSTKTDDCQTSSIFLLRMSFASCICRNASPSQVNTCTQFLSQHMIKECPAELNAACFKSMAQMIAEKMKIAIHDPYKI